MSSLLAFDRVIPWVFELNFIIIFTDCSIVPWGVLSLLVVSLLSIKVTHHWLVIKWFSSMLDFNTFICLLEFKHSSGQDGAQDPESCLLWLKLHGVLFYSWLYTYFYYIDGCDHTMRLYIHNDPCYLDGYTHVNDLLFSLHHLDGYFHAMDSCLNLIYVCLYASLICRSLDSACPCPCQNIVKHLVLPSCFRGHLLHSIFLCPSHFPMKYPKVFETWSLYNILIHVYSLDPSFNST